MGLPALRAQEVMIDKIVAVVGSSAILYSDLDELAQKITANRREKGYTPDRDPRSEALEQLMLQKLLYNQAQIDSVKIQTEDLIQMAEENVQQQIRLHGSIKALEAFYHKPIFEIKEDIRQQYEEMRYAQEMQSEIRGKVKITPGEVDKFFRSLPKDSLPLIPEQYIYAQITKFPSSIQEAKQRVRERLLEMRERILNGTRFEMLARMYSVDGSASRGGEMDPTPREGFVKPFSDAMVKLKEGQISEVVETEYGFHLIQMVKKDGNLYTVRHILLRPVYTDAELSQTAATLDSVATVVQKGDITFEKAAAEFSDDKYSRQNGGLVTNHEMLEMYQANDAKYTSTRFLKEELPVADYNALRTLKPGEMSNSFLTQDMRGNQMAKLVKLIEIIPSHPANMKDDYLRLEEAALDSKQERMFKEWLDQKVEGMYVRIEPGFRYDDFDNKFWLK